MSKRSAACAGPPFSFLVIVQHHQLRHEPAALRLDRVGQLTATYQRHQTPVVRECGEADVLDFRVAELQDLKLLFSLQRSRWCAPSNVCWCAALPERMMLSIPASRNLISTYRQAR